MRSPPPRPSKPDNRPVRPLLTLLVVLLTVTACSRMQFAYRQLDWILSGYLDDLVELDGPQQLLADRAIADLLAWHCGTQLVDYARLLRDAGRDFRDGQMSRQRLQEYSGRIDGLWSKVLAAAAPPLTELLRSMSDAQVQQLRRSFDERNAEYAEDTVEPSAGERSQAIAERLSDRLDPWIGDLNRAQQQTVTGWAAALQTPGKMRLATRKRWQRALLSALRDRHSAAFEDQVRPLLSHPRSLYTEAFRQALDQDQQRTLAMVQGLALAADRRQLEQLAERTGAWAADFEQLACRRPQAARVVQPPTIPATRRPGPAT